MFLAEILLLAAWIGAVAGLGEALVVAVQRLVLHDLTHYSPDVVWMAPLTNFAILAPIGVAFWLSGKVIPWPNPRRLVLAGFTFIAAFGILFMFEPQLHRAATLLLAGGVAAQAARAADASTKHLRFVRRTFGWVMAVVVAVTMGLHGWRWVSEQRTLAALPPAQAGAPNVLLIVLDTVRAQSLSVYGYGRSTTPQLERLARQGVRFDRALSTASWTLPSHATMFTGRYPHELSADWQRPLDRTYPTLAEVLSARGYLTAGFVANTGYTSRELGLDRGFSHYEDFQMSPGTIVSNSSLGRFITWNRRLRRMVSDYRDLGRKSAATVNSDFLDWLSTREERPFFVFLNYFDAHDPYVPPAPFDVKFGPFRPVQQNGTAHKSDLSAEEIAAMVDGYDSSIAYLDHELGRLLDELERQQILDDTLVIVTADHGEEFGEHDVFAHGHTLYMPSLHVPLLVRFPQRTPAGVAVHETVTLRDLAATITDLVGIGDEVAFPGRSFAHFWNDTSGAEPAPASPVLSEVSHVVEAPPYLPVSKGDMKSVTLGTLRYIRNGDASEELYSLDTDAGEQRNLAGSEEGRAALSRFRGMLETILGRPASSSPPPP